jgi:hypothetical protein
MSHWISPKYSSHKLANPSLADLIDVFEDRIKGWIFNPATALLKSPEFRIASLCLQLTYFEGIWVYMTGADSHSRSKEFFRNGFIDVFRVTGTNEMLLARAADALYEDARCGFFHDGMFKDRIFFTSRGWALEITLPKKNGQIDESGEIQSIMIDPTFFLEAVVRHFDGYVQSLRMGSDKEIQGNFQKGWVLRQGRPRIIGVDDSQSGEA